MIIREVYRFPYKYDVELLNDLTEASNSIKRFEFPEEAELNVDSVTVKIITSTGESWIGTFAPGYVPSNAISQISSCPNPNNLCIINKGQGYIINSLDPTSYLEIKAFPILEVHLLNEQQLMLFVDFTEIAAYDVNGFKWITGRLSSDGLKVTLVEKDHIKVVGWDAPTNSDIEIFIKLDDGTRL